MRGPSARALAHPWRAAWALAALALLLRLLVLVPAPRFGLQQEEWDRGYEVGAVARALASGRGFADPFAAPSGPTTMISPAVPALWSVPLRLLGQDSALAWRLIAALDALALALVVPALFALGRRAVSDRAGLLAAAAWSVHPLGVMLVRGYLGALAWFALAVVLVAERLLAVEQESAAGRRAPWLSCGLTIGASAWIEPLLAPPLLAWGALAIVRRRPHASAAVRCALVALLVVSPWIARNAVVAGRATMRGGAGPELLAGAVAGPGEETPMRIHPSRNRLEMESLQRAGERAYTDDKLGQARARIAEDPARWGLACAWRFGTFWLGRASWWSASPTQPVLSGPFSALRGLIFAGLALAAAAGLALARRTPPARLLAVLLALYPLTYALTHVEARYRLPVEPLLTLAAVLGACALLEARAVRQGS